MDILSKEILIGIITFLFSGYIIVGRFILNRIMKTLNMQWKEVQDRLDKIEISLNQNNINTNACLYNDLDDILRKAEVTNVWSSDIAERWEIMYDKYLKGGDGFDGGKSLRQRADKILVDNVKYAENIIKYNRYKQNAIENQEV